MTAKTCLKQALKKLSEMNISQENKNMAEERIHEALRWLSND